MTFARISYALVCTIVFAALAVAGNTAEGYDRRLKSLDHDRPESVCVARDLLRSLMTKANSRKRTLLFRTFRSFYLRAIDETEPGFAQQMQPFAQSIAHWFMQSETPDPVEALLSARPDVRLAAQPWLKCGFSVIGEEGDLYPAQDSATLLEFASELSRDSESYIRFRSREDTQDVAGDAALEISWEQLRLRIERWEAFARRHPELPETQSEIQPMVHSLARLYLFGIDNTPSCDLRTGQIDPKLVASWKIFAAEDRASSYRALVANLLLRLDSDNQTIFEPDRILFRQYGFEKEFDQWWRCFQIQMRKH